MADNVGIQRAIALLTVVLDEESEPDDALVEAIAPGLDDARATDELLKGLAELSAWLLMQLEAATGEPPSRWLQRAALEFA